MKLAAEGRGLTAGLAALTLLAALVPAWGLGWRPGAWWAVPLALGALLAFTAWFFRDPERRPPADPSVLVSPADGKVLRVGPNGVSVFMNVFDVHVCRIPMAGRVTAVEHVPGSFRAAYRDAASEHNERAHIVVRNGARELRCTLVAGLVARRIVSRVKPGQDLELGQRIGVIRFGSRVDVILPRGCSPAVERGQRVFAGSTIIARLPAGDGSPTDNI